MNTKTIVMALCCAAMATVYAGGEAASDKGEEIAAKATEKTADLQSTAGSTFVPAEDQVTANIKKLGLVEGYDRQRKSIIAKGTAYYQCKNPAEDKNFLFIRAKKAKQAYLNAKAEIIRAILTEMSATDKAVVLSDEGDDSATAKFSAKKTAFTPKVSAFVMKLIELDKDEGDALKARELDDTFGAYLDTLAMKLSAWTVKQDAVNKDALLAILEGLKTQLAALREEWKGMETEAAAIAAVPDTELSSKATLTSKMPLLGATVLTQTESWDATDGTYSISMAVVWSKKLQESAKRLAIGDTTPSAKKGKYSVQEWMDLQDMTRMAGSRRITDKDGQTAFIGIAAVEVPSKAGKITAAQRKAQTAAFVDVGFSLVGDVAAFTEASSNLKEFIAEEGKDDKYQTSDKLTDKVSQSIEKLNISGILKLKEQTAIHPISGKKTYFCAYYIDAGLAKDALEILKKLYADAITVRKASQYRAGVHAGAEASLKAQRESKAEFNKGMKDAQKDIKNMVDADEAARAAKKMPGATGAAGSEKKGNAGAQGGTFTGDAEVDTDI